MPINLFYNQTRKRFNRILSGFPDSIERNTLGRQGKPDVHREIWKRDLYKNEKDNWRMAIAVGDLGYFTQWNRETSIRHSLSVDNFKIKHSLIYSNEELEKEYEEFTEKKKIGKEFSHLKIQQRLTKIRETACH